MPRKTIAALEAQIEDLREELAEARMDADRADFERDDWQRTAGERATLLDRADDEVLFLRSIVHGLVPGSLR